MTWWQRVWRRDLMEQQLHKELRFHMEHHVADLVARGRDPEEAKREARLMFGGEEQIKETCRDARGTRWLEDLWQDCRYAVRTLRQKPGFAAVALLTLALGIGATTVMFTVIDGVLLKPLPYAEPGRLVEIAEQTDWSTAYGNRWAFAYPNYLDCWRESRSLALAATKFTGGTLSAPGDAEAVSGLEISSSLFTVLGVPLFRGRVFLPEEDRPGGAPVAIISYALWQRKFAGSEHAIGMPLVLEGKSLTVVGIASGGLRLNSMEFDLFTPLGQDVSPYFKDRSRHPGINAVGRLAPGVTLVQAQTELGLIGRRLAAQYPDSNRGRTFVVQPLRVDVGDVRSTLWLLLGAVSLVLLIACANIASLLLARAVSRERELAMRVALGASRGRLVRQCLTESAVLGLAGGVLGIVLAVAGIRPFVVLWPGSLPRAEEVQVDWRVLLFAMGAALASGLLFGMAPAVRASLDRLEHSLRSGARTMAGGSRRLHGGFVAAEIALAVVLLVSAGMLGRTLLQLSALDPGMNYRNVLVTRLGISPAALTSPDRVRAAWQDVLDRSRRVPGVEAAAIVDTVPMRQGNNQLTWWTSASLPPEGQRPLTLATSVTPDYLKVMAIPLRRGRFFTDLDRIGSEPVVVIDEDLAQRAFGGLDAIGKHLWMPQMGADPVRVIGVVGHVRHWGLAGDDQARVRAQLYYPLAQVPDQLTRRWAGLMSIAFRTSVPPLTLVEPLRREVRGSSNDQVLYEVRTMEGLVGDSLARQRFLLLLFGIFAALAMVLACVGIYGVIAYLTSRRVPEIGVRMALGAGRSDVMWLVLRQSLGMIFAGLGVGIAAALAAGRVLERLVQGMRPMDSATFGAMIAVLVLAALAASLAPARRASRIDPLRALRQE